MRAVVQRVSEACVKVDGQAISQIGPGFLILLGVCDTDTQSEAAYLAEKCANLRVFEDADGKMNRSLLQSGGAILLVSNFTLYGDCKKGRRPNFIQAARPKPPSRCMNILQSAVSKTAFWYKRVFSARI